MQERTYAYSYSKPIHWKMEMFSCTCDDDDAGLDLTGEEEKGEEGEEEVVESNEETDGNGVLELERDGLVLFQVPVTGVRLC